MTIRLVKCGRHVPSSTPLAPCSICRYTKRTSCSIWPCIKYASGRMHAMFTLRTQHSVGSSSPQPVLYGSPSTSSPSSSPSRASVIENQAQIPLSRPTPRIQVASLLADPQTRYIIFFSLSLFALVHFLIGGRSYHLEIVQQPQKTAEFGQSNLSRLPVTPPIIAQLTVRDPSGNSVVPYVCSVLQHQTNLHFSSLGYFGCTAARLRFDRPFFCFFFSFDIRHLTI